MDRACYAYWKSVTADFPLICSYWLPMASSCRVSKLSLNGHIDPAASQCSCASTHWRACRSCSSAYLAAFACPVGDHPAQTFPVALIGTRPHVAEPAATRYEVNEQARTEVAVFGRSRVLFRESRIHPDPCCRPLRLLT